MTWTLLRDNFYPDFFPLFADDEGVIRGPAGNGRVAAVGRADVADVAVEVLRNPSRHAGAAYTVSGPEPFSVSEACGRMTVTLGRPFSYVEETVEEAYASRRRWSTEPWQLDAWSAPTWRSRPTSSPTSAPTSSGISGHRRGRWSTLCWTPDSPSTPRVHRLVSHVCGRGHRVVASGACHRGMLSLAPATATSPRERLVVAHRGASGYLPEHTLAAYELAVAQGADYLEPDLVVTADGHLVVRHENEIGETTDIAIRPEFADRRTRKVVDGVARTGWFSEDFTLAELRSLGATERLPYLRPGSAAFDSAFGIVTFEQVLDLAQRSRTPDGRPVGVLAELKHATYFAALGLDVVPRVLAALDAVGYHDQGDPVMVQSFETTCLQQLAERSPIRLGQLLEVDGAPYDLVAAGDGRTFADLRTTAGLAGISRYADVVGLDKELVLPRGIDGRLLGATGITTAAHDVGLEVFGWTFRRENRFLPLEFRRGTDPAAPGDLAGEIAVHLAAGLDSVITDHPDLAGFAHPVAALAA